MAMSMMSSKLHAIPAVTAPKPRAEPGGSSRRGEWGLAFQGLARRGIIPCMHQCFSRELSRFGPQRTYAPVRLSEARHYGSRLARTHYENFTIASLLLPRRL